MSVTNPLTVSCPYFLTVGVLIHCCFPECKLPDHRVHVCTVAVAALQAPRWGCDGGAAPSCG